jgi:hypothetical protein
VRNAESICACLSGSPRQTTPRGSTTVSEDLTVATNELIVVVERPSGIPPAGGGRCECAAVRCEYSRLHERSKYPLTSNWVEAEQTGGLGMRESKARHFSEFRLNSVAQFVFFVVKRNTREAHHHLLVKIVRGMSDSGTLTR